MPISRLHRINGSMRINDKPWRTRGFAYLPFQFFTLRRQDLSEG
jgi:hypothetical protein